ncbi:hypothetical protein [Ruegeria sp.]|uniref:hypothetical protein n=1 Tax=Ruegeria sp. TaxID=1879320 RepID=UPI003B00007E
MSVAFDTLKAAQRLSAAGFSEDQAATLAATFAEGITENLATKDDIALLQKDIQRVDAKIDASVAALQKDSKALDAKIDASVAALNTKIDASVAALQKDNKALDAKIDASFATLDVKIDASIEALRKEMIVQNKDMKILLGSIMVGGIVVMTLLDRLL